MSTRNKFLLVVFFCISISYAQVPMPLLKAMFIYNFAAQTEWPEAYRSGDFVIGVLGTSPITKELEKLAATKKIGTQKMVVKVFSSAAALENCHLLFISEGQSSAVSEVANTTQSNSTLLVSESPDLCKKGAMMNFIMKSEKLSFELSKSNMSKANLKPTTYLEKLAIPVN